jgi:hypothetical protein
MQRKKNQFQVADIDDVVAIQVSVRVPALVVGLAGQCAGNYRDVATGHLAVAA